MLLADIVSTSNTVAATRSRKAKVAALAECLGKATRAELPVVTAYLAGTLLQRRTGLGWRSLSTLPSPAADASLTASEVHEAFERMSLLSGSGSQVARAGEAETLFGAATTAEQVWLRGVVTGEVRQGALDSLVQEALAVAAGVPLPAVRRAAMLAGSTVVVAGLAFDGEEALAEVGLVVGRPVMPMLASSAGSVEEALAKIGGPAVVDTKLDGIRIQVHRQGEEVVIATRTLDDITARLPEVVEIVRSLQVSSVVLDGEAMLVGPDGRPRPFQETASRTATRGEATAVVAPFFFDVLHLDGADLLGSPLSERLALLDSVVPAQHRIARVVTDDPAAGEAFAAGALAGGQEGVVVKGLEVPWEAGRRGSGWIKVKPVHTLDLVVLGVEWGSGRRKGWLSNIHLGARGPDGFVMIGKTFKGMTDQMLAWQTERFSELALADPHSDWVVEVRPEQVVEIAFDGVQRSTRYPGGVALRFARVVRYRDDKTAAEADTIATVQDFLD
ncbi:DNA ligase-1 [Nocardioides sp. YR527]|uniref:ATP-dependent DNA ligase n=1 Tax=Nocardioides sp. YR527 TaxID=1881028 RepID=UPI00088DA428|nr:ATP-dependent DNA ligase [Nocardioides sp. YR527]SDJ79775.1 DNA ligase-1 [Nocardioides sp. YR527]